MLRFTSRLACGAVLAVAVAAALGAAVFAPVSHGAVGTCTPDSAWPVNRPDLAGSVVSLVNSHRTGMGLTALQVSPTLTAAAVWKARHMAQYQYLQHDDPAPPVARTVSDRLAACGYPIGSVGWGENIAYGYQTPSNVVTAWLNSPGHRANIENASFRATGVGAAAASNGLIYWAQDFGTYVDGGGGGSGGTAPTVTLTSGPGSSTTSTSATFGWTTSGSGSATTCSLDGGAATACSSPRTYTGLAAGAHTFRVEVSNAYGSSGAAYSWTITSSSPAAPTVTLTSKPASSTSTSASFAWSTTGAPTSTLCSLDGAAAAACTSPKAYTGLSVGTHTFRVTVSNAGGSNSASYTWSVLSSTPPPPPPSGPLSVSLTSTPPATTTSTSASFSWTVTGTASAVGCMLDGSFPVACSGSKTYSGLRAGAHTFVVSATGPGGVVASATWRWTIG